MKRRVLALALAILAFFIFVGSPFQQSANAVVLLDDAIIAIVIAAMAACGIAIVAQDGFNTVSDYMREQISRYCSSIGSSAQHELNGVQYGRNTLGQILLNNKFLRFISAFMSWFQTDKGITNNSTQILANDMYIAVQDGDVPIYMPLKNNGYGWLIIDEGPGMRRNNPYDYIEGFSLNHAYKLASGKYFKIWKEGNKYTWRVSSTEDMTDEILGYTIRAGWTPWIEATYNNPIDAGNNQTVWNGTAIFPVFRNAADANDYYFIIVCAQYLDISGGSYGELGMRGIEPDTAISGADFRTYFIPYSQTVTSVSTAVVPPIDMPDYDEGDGAILDVGAAWGDTIDDILDGVIPEQMVDDGVIDSSIAFQEENAINEELVDDQYQSISQDPSEYQVNGLADVFPFCIPFDIYNFVSCLAADPVAPSFTWRFYVPGICDETIEIDFSDFDQAAQLLRTMELLLFCVGLAFVTRKIIRG